MNSSLGPLWDSEITVNDVTFIGPLKSSTAKV